MDMTGYNLKVFSLILILANKYGASIPFDKAMSPEVLIGSFNSYLK